MYIYTERERERERVCVCLFRTNTIFEQFLFIDQILFSSIFFILKNIYLLKYFSFPLFLNVQFRLFFLHYSFLRSD